MKSGASTSSIVRGSQNGVCFTGENAVLRGVSDPCCRLRTLRKAYIYQHVIYCRTEAFIHVGLDSDEGLNEFDREALLVAEIGFRG
jgi:hypothetical protein